MVIPRSRSSGALSIWSYAVNWASPCFASTLVIAAVSVVFPWSTCPIVPTFTWGFVLSNFSLLILILDEWSPFPGLNWRPHPYQGCALPTELKGPVSLLLHLQIVGAGNGIRTRDIQLGRLTLYHLSYSRLSPWWRGLDSNQRRRRAGRFTVCSLWPLGYPSVSRLEQLPSNFLLRS